MWLLSNTLLSDHRPKWWQQLIWTLWRHNLIRPKSRRRPGAGSCWPKRRWWRAAGRWTGSWARAPGSPAPCCATTAGCRGGWRSASPAPAGSPLGGCGDFRRSSPGRLGAQVSRHEAGKEFTYLNMHLVSVLMFPSEKLQKVTFCKDFHPKNCYETSSDQIFIYF